MLTADESQVLLSKLDTSSRLQLNILRNLYLVTGGFVGILVASFLGTLLIGHLVCLIAGLSVGYWRFDMSRNRLKGQSEVIRFLIERLKTDQS